MDEQKKAALIAKFSEVEKRNKHKQQFDSFVAEIIERAKKKRSPAVLN